MLSYNERLRGENTGWKMNFFIFLHKKYPYDFKIEIIGAFSSTYSVGCFIFCFSNIITVFSVRQSSRQVAHFYIDICIVVFKHFDKFCNRRYMIIIGILI